MKKPTCPHASSGCNYPEGECAGHCFTSSMPVQLVEHARGKECLGHRVLNRVVPVLFVAVVLAVAFKVI